MQWWYINVLVGYWLLVLTIALSFFSEESFEVSQMLRMKARAKYMAWAGLVPATVLVWRVVGTVASEALMLPLTMTMTMTLVAGIVLTTVIGSIMLTGVTAVKQVVVTVSGTMGMAVAVVVAGMAIWAGTKRDTLTYGTLGPSAVGNVVAVTLTLALVLTVAMADVGAVTFAVTTIVIVTVIIANMGWMALVDVAVMLSQVIPRWLQGIIMLYALMPITTMGGAEVAIQICDSRVVQVIGRSSVTQSIFKTIARLPPALKATPYIIHSYTYIGLDESRPSPPTTRYPVASIVGSIEAGHKYVHSLPISSGSGSSRVSLQELFGGWSPSLTVVQCLKEAQKDLSE